MKTASLAVALLTLAALQPALPAGPLARASGFSCCGDPIHWAARHDAGQARIAITTQDGKVTLLLTPAIVALQLSERTLHKVDRKLRDHEDQDNPLADAIQTAVLETVRELLDHSAECPVRELRDVAYRDGRLVFTTRAGKHIFDDLEVNDSQVMDGFSERDARAFVAEFRQLKGQEY